MEVGILGATGPAGRGLAARLASAGLAVTLGSRDPERAKAVVEDLRQRFGERLGVLDGADNAGAIERSSVVVLGVTWKATVQTAAEHAHRLAEKVVISMASPLAKRRDAFLAVPVPSVSVALGVAAAAPRAMVAAAFHHVPAAAFERLDQPMDGDVIICATAPGAFDAAKSMIAAMPQLRSLDGGPLENSVALEAFTAVLLTVNARHGGRATLRLPEART